MRATSEPATDDAGLNHLPSRERIHQWALAYLRHAPVSLCLRELHRLVAMESIDADLGRPSPVLDVGCGDGYWWTLRDVGDREIYGIDVSANEVAQASKRIHATVADVSIEPPFAPQKFRQIVGNCSIEHVRNIDGALSNLRACATPDASLILFVPAPQWAYQGKLQSSLLRRAPRVAMTVSGALNGFFQHWHLYDVPVWQRLLERNGWRIRRTEGLGNRHAEFLFRLFLPPAFGQFLYKSAFGVYPSRINRHVPAAMLRPLTKMIAHAVANPFVSIDSPHAYEFAIIADCAP